jgi:hypothetical protein
MSGENCHSCGICKPGLSGAACFSGICCSCL